MATNPAELDLLRRAAALMRHRAEGATPGPWWVHDHNETDVWAGDQAAVRKVDANGCCARPGIKNCDGACEDLLRRADPLSHGDLKRPEDAAHIASWDPPVALTIAAWLDQVTVACEHGGRAALFAPEAIAVARAYLREDC